MGEEETDVTLYMLAEASKLALEAFYVLRPVLRGTSDETLKTQPDFVTSRATLALRTAIAEYDRQFEEETSD